jgi:hypothetical protein
MLTDNMIHRAGRVDQIVRDYFFAHAGIDEILAKGLMPLFVEKACLIKTMFVLVSPFVIF